MTPIQRHHRGTMEGPIYANHRIMDPSTGHLVTTYRNRLRLLKNQGVHFCVLDILLICDLISFKASISFVHNKYQLEEY